MNTPSVLDMVIVGSDAGNQVFLRVCTGRVTGHVGCEAGCGSKIFKEGH